VAGLGPSHRLYAALWPVSDRATASTQRCGRSRTEPPPLTEGLLDRGRPSVRRFGRVRDPRRTWETFRQGQRPAPNVGDVSAGSETRAERGRLAPQQVVSVRTPNRYKLWCLSPFSALTVKRGCRTPAADIFRRRVRLTGISSNRHHPAAKRAFPFVPDAAAPWGRAGRRGPVSRTSAGRLGC
jgi:hypothetical protein